MLLCLSLSAFPFFPKNMRTKVAKKGAYRQNLQGLCRLYFPLNGSCHLDIPYTLDGGCHEKYAEYPLFRFMTVKPTLAKRVHRPQLHPQVSWRYKNTIMYWVHIQILYTARPSYNFYDLRGGGLSTVFVLSRKNYILNDISIYWSHTPVSVFTNAFFSHYITQHLTYKESCFTRASQSRTMSWGITNRTCSTNYV